MIGPAYIVIIEAFDDIIGIVRQLVREHRVMRNDMSLCVDGQFMRTRDRLTFFCFFIPHNGQMFLHFFPLFRRIVISLIVIADTVGHIIHR